MSITSRKRLSNFWCHTKLTAKEHPRLFTLYMILRLLVVAVLIVQLLNRDYKNVFLCFLTLVLFAIPSFIEHRIKVDVPDTLEVIILLFIFSADILGEIREYYVNVPGWDTMLHTINGFLCAAIGVALIDILNRSDRFSIKMSPLFVALVAFCFSMTIGVLWEFFEFACDHLFTTDMQKDTVVNSISSVLLNPGGRNIPVIISDITGSVIISSSQGQTAQTAVYGYLDIGLLDTMKDLFVNFIGAIVFSAIGYFYVKYRKAGKSSKFVNRFMLTRIPDDQADSALSASSFGTNDDERPL